MFQSRYYLMALIALFYRTTLLEFAERTALISKRIFRDWEDGKLSKGNVRFARNLNISERKNSIFFSWEES
jgi:hypothetical protein